MTLPRLLLVEIRFAFKSCARQPSTFRTSKHGFQTFNPFLKRKSTTPQAVKPVPKQVAKREPNAANRSEAKAESASASSSIGTSKDIPTQTLSTTKEPLHPADELPEGSRDLVPTPSKPSSISRPRRVDVPVKVLPKEQATPELKLTPTERIQIEWLTRKPPKAEAPKLFKSRLLIYHGGLARWRFLSISKVATIFVLCGFVTVIAPAYYTFGYPWWAAALILLGGSVPFVLVAFTSRPFVTWIHLVLPHFARQSPKAALDYSRNLPANATLQISFMRATTLPATIEANVADLVPTKSIWRPMTFEWVGNRVDKGRWYRPNPTRFYVRPESGRGKEARDTVPGIWENVYKRIMGVESEAVAKWRK